jgi:hypothetical protein
MDMRCVAGHKNTTEPISIYQTAMNSELGNPCRVVDLNFCRSRTFDHQLPNQRERYLGDISNVRDVNKNAPRLRS